METTAADEGCGNYWVLKGNQPVRATLLEWGKFFDSPAKLIWEFRYRDMRVVTAFFGHDIDYDLGERPVPLLFGTKIFGGPHDGQESLSATYEEAAQQHSAAVELVEEAQLRREQLRGVDDRSQTPDP